MIHWINESLGFGAINLIEKGGHFEIIDVRDLADKKGNDPAVVAAKIEEALRHLKNGKRVVVCCDYGISRSAAVATGVLANLNHLSFDDALKHVMTQTGQKSMKIEVLAAVREALAPQNSSPALQKAGMTPILLTGASGFIGSRLKEKLRKRFEVVMPRREEIDLVSDSLGLDLLVKQRNIQLVIHLAAPRIYTAVEAMGTSIVMLKNILDLCVENRCRLIVPSSWEIYSGYRAQELLADESLSPCPGGTYGQAKLLCETLIENYRKQHELKCTILRSSPVYGVDGARPMFLWNFIEKAVRGTEIITHRYSNGFPCVDLLHIDDICEAILAAVEQEAAGTFNLGGGQCTSTAEIARMIVDRIGSTSNIRHHDIQGYAPNIVMDIRRAAKEFGWNPTVRLAEGLQDLIDKGLSKQRHAAYK